MNGMNWKGGGARVRSSFEDRFEGRGGDEAINRGFPHHIIYECNMYTWEGSEGEKYLELK